MQNYKVIREHWGDKQYKVGDVRKANPADVQHLIGNCLAPQSAEKKAQPLENKAVKPAKTKAGK